MNPIRCSNLWLAALVGATLTAISGEPAVRLEPAPLYQFPADPDCNLGECPDREYFTVPDIGVARSTDQGRTWKDLGIALQDLGVDRSCETPNKFFAGGVGDPSWAIDRTGEHAYIFFSSYPDPTRSRPRVRSRRAGIGMCR